MLDHYPWFLDTYDALPKPIMKADSVRYLYMYHVGGAEPPYEHWSRTSPPLTHSAAFLEQCTTLRSLCCVYSACS